MWKSGKRNIENQSQVSLSYAEWKARKDAFDIFEVQKSDCYELLLNNSKQMIKQSLSAIPCFQSRLEN